MWYPATVAAPTTEPVTVDQARTQARAEGSEDGALLERLIKTARAMFERMNGVRYGARTGIAMTCDCWPDLSHLPEAPVTAVSSITYVDTDGVTQTLSTDVYELRATELEAAIVLKYGQSWPAIRSGSRITVTASIGYATAPEDIQHAMLLTITHWYENRGVAADNSMQSLPWGVEALICNHRRYA